MKRSSGQLIVHADLGLSRGVFVRNMYLHGCVYSEKKKLERKENQERVVSQKQREEKDFFKDWPMVLNDRDIKYKKTDKYIYFSFSRKVGDRSGWLWVEEQAEVKEVEPSVKSAL